MKQRIYQLFVITLLSLCFTSCSNDDNNSPDLNGIYSGTFTVEYINGNTFSNPVTVTFNNGNSYQSTGNSDYFPAGGNGTYQKNGSKVTFNDTNYWTANFDWNLILAGEYEYTFNGDNLIISTNRADFGLYKYELKKEE